jgi:hypothetical protein
MRKQNGWTADVLPAEAAKVVGAMEKSSAIMKKALEAAKL